MRTKNRQIYNEPMRTDRCVGEALPRPVARVLRVGIAAGAHNREPDATSGPPASLELGNRHRRQVALGILEHMRIIGRLDVAQESLTRRAIEHMEDLHTRFHLGGREPAQPSTDDPQGRRSILGRFNHKLESLPRRSIVRCGHGLRVGPYA